MTLPTVIDLMALANAMEGAGGDQKLVRALKSAWRAQSCLGDLNQSAGLCAALDMLRASDSATDAAIRSESETAMLAMAIINYARATHSGSKDGGRGAIQLDRAKLTEQQREDHDILVEVRNRTLAHVQPSEAIGGAEWHSVLLFARRSETQGWAVASATKRVTFHKETFERLKRQLPAAAAIVKEKSQKRLSAVIDLFNATPPTEKAMLQHAFDPVEMFGSEARAQYILGGLPGADLAVQDT